MSDLGFLAAIRQDPDNDDLRLVYADWLEDHDDLARAEFIRVQLALAREGCEHLHPFGDCPGCTLRRREEELLSSHGTEWLAAVLPGFGLRLSNDWMSSVPERLACQRQAAFRRGLVSVLFLQMPDFLLNGADYVKRLATLVRVQLIDRWPGIVDHHAGYCWSGKEADAESYHFLPLDLADRLPAAAEGSFSLLSYPTEGEALAALSRACILHLRNGPRRSHFAETFTTSQVAEICQVAPSTVSHWFDSGRLNGYRRPGSLERQARREWLLRFLRENDIPFGASFPDWGEGDLEGGPSAILLGWDP